MYTFKRINNFEEAFFYRKFTFPFYRKCLTAEHLDNSSIAIAVIDFKQPIGLALAQILPNSRSAEILSIYVSPSHRCQGIGTSLLNFIEQELVLRGYVNARLNYTNSQPSTPALEKLLQKNHWTYPQTELLICKCDYKMLKAPWLNREYYFPPEFSIFPWIDITSEERFTIQQQQETESWIPEQLVPFQYEKDLEPLNSLGLRHQNRVVGWLITHRIAPNTIRYTCSFVKKELQSMGLSIFLYVEGVKRQAASMPDFKATWSVSVSRRPMINFIEKYLKPYLTSLEENKYSSKLLE